MVVAAGLLKIPADVEMKTLYNATYSGPVMPWIDPVKEAEAWRIQIRGGRRDGIRLDPRRRAQPG